MPVRDTITPMNLPIRRHPVTCEVNGKTYHGTYWVAGRILTVTTGKDGKSRQVGSVPNEVLAKQLLEILVQEGKADR